MATSSGVPAPRCVGAVGGAATIAGIIVAMHYFGREVLIPLALAIMLSLLLAPLVRNLRVMA